MRQLVVSSAGLVLEDWRAFVARGDIRGLTNVRREVLESWLRSRQAGVDPFRSQVVAVSTEELTERRKRQQALLDVAVPLLRMVAESIRGSGFRVDLFDGDLILLEQFGDDDVLHESAQLGSYPGVDKSEHVVGTSAINLCVWLREPVQIAGAEHYCRALHHWTCSAAPIVNRDGSVVAVINIAGQSHLVHRHTLGMVAALAKAVEFSLRQNELRNEVEERNQYLRAVIDSIDDSLVVVDRNGVVTFSNQAAEQAAGAAHAVRPGTSVSQFCGDGNPFIRAIETGMDVPHAEVVFGRQQPRRRYFGSIKLVRGSSGAVVGAVGLLKGMRSAAAMMKEVGGLKARFTFDDLVGEDPRFQAAVALARRVAALPVRVVLLVGETGTGKELFAQAMHNASPFSGGPFVAINCAAIPSELIESELFGYEEGAFTGARRGGMIGKFELAEGGTLFLDEVTSAPLALQAKLLRVIETGSFMRVGGKEEIAVRARIIVAAQPVIFRALSSGDFRSDLYYRISGVTIKLPPLRERSSDVPVLARYFVAKHARLLGIAEPELDPGVMRMLMSYQWPGNVRQLENTIERALVTAHAFGSKVVKPEHIVLEATVSTTERVRGSLSLRSAERQWILEALNQHQSLAACARALGISRNTLYRKMKQYGLDRRRKQRLYQYGTEPEFPDVVASPPLED